MNMYHAMLLLHYLDTLNGSREARSCDTASFPPAGIDESSRLLPPSQSATIFVTFGLLISSTEEQALGSRYRDVPGKNHFHCEGWLTTAVQSDETGHLARP